MTGQDENKPKKQQIKDAFIQDISCLLLIDSFEGSSLFRFLAYWSKRLQNDHIDLFNVFTEGVKRGLAYIEEKEEAIDKPEAWLRPVCLNILRDEVKHIIREERKSEHVSYLASSLRHNFLSQPMLVEQFACLDEAMQSLSEADRLIIRLKFFEDMKYEDIKTHLSYFQNEDISVAALRKRLSRAVDRLRENFLVLYEGDSMHSF